MIQLYQPKAPGWPRIRNMSPFCLKLEAWLAFAKIPYETKFADPRNAPKGKIPWIVDTQTGLKIGDSGLIIDYLKKQYSVDVDNFLTPEQSAVSVCLQRTIEEHLYFGALVMRWGDQNSFAYVFEFFSRFLPPVIGGFIMKKIRKDVLNQGFMQGMGRHSRDEMIALMKADIDAISQLLGSKKFMHGDRPSSIDVILYAFIANFIWVPWDNEFKKYGLTKQNLVAHCETMDALLFSK